MTDQSISELAIRVNNHEFTSICTISGRHLVLFKGKDPTLIQVQSVESGTKEPNSPLDPS